MLTTDDMAYAGCESFLRTFVDEICIINVLTDTAGPSPVLMLDGTTERESVTEG